ncbi:MAG TPA: redoxin domain-containing protein [Thermoanaerobaculia bacterium]|nr:redoxin domain-containing protein [Thermoanaerobaculia bacterium]
MSVAFFSSYVALWVLMILQSLILLTLLRMVHELRSSGAGGRSAFEGKPAPELTATALDGTRVGSDQFLGRLTALLFVSTTCPSCTTTLQELRGLYLKSHGNVIVVCKANRQDTLRLVQTFKLEGLRVIADEDDHIGQLYGITSVPTAVLINGNGRIQSYGHPLREELEQAFQAASPAEAGAQENRKVG